MAYHKPRQYYESGKPLRDSCCKRSIVRLVNWKTHLLNLTHQEKTVIIWLYALVTFSFQRILLQGALLQYVFFAAFAADVFLAGVRGFVVLCLPLVFLG